MKGALRICVIAGIEISVHWSLLAFGALLLLIPWPSSPVDLGFRAGYLVVLFASVLLHEFGHAMAGRFCDGNSDRIVLWPLGGLAFVHLPDAPIAHFLTALAGPLVSLALSLISRSLIPLAGGWASFTLVLLARINWTLWLFNLIPGYPMDGGRLLHAVLWRKWGYAKAL